MLTLDLLKQSLIAVITLLSNNNYYNNKVTCATNWKLNLPKFFVSCSGSYEKFAFNVQISTMTEVIHFYTAVSYRDWSVFMSLCESVSSICVLWPIVCESVLHEKVQMFHLCMYFMVPLLQCKYTIKYKIILKTHTYFFFLQISCIIKFRNWYISCNTWYFTTWTNHSLS